jgi:hypothetical protein
VTSAPSRDENIARGDAAGHMVAGLWRGTLVSDIMPWAERDSGSEPAGDVGGGGGATGTTAWAAEKGEVRWTSSAIGASY